MKSILQQITESRQANENKIVYYNSNGQVWEELDDDRFLYCVYGKNGKELNTFTDQKEAVDFLKNYNLESRQITEATSLETLKKIAEKAEYLVKLTHLTVNSFTLLDIKNTIDDLVDLRKKL
jgi:hypothetical protein